jgi:hypothetical protein
MKSRVEGLLGKIEVKKGKSKGGPGFRTEVTLSNSGRGYRYRYSGEPTPHMQEGGSQSLFSILKLMRLEQSYQPTSTMSNPCETLPYPQGWDREA